MKETTSAFLTQILKSIGIIAALAFITFWTWNWVGVDVLNLKTITYWQALGLNILANAFFKDSLMLQEIINELRKK